jgi:hypothetical protein
VATSRFLASSAQREAAGLCPHGDGVKHTIIRRRRFASAQL